MNRDHGRMVLGGIAGFFALLFLGIDLVLFGVIPFTSALVTLLPVLGVLVGVAWAWWAPLRSR